MARKDQILTTVTVGNIITGLAFREFSGGGLTSAKIKGRNGANTIERARGGRQMVDDVTVTREDEDPALDIKGLQAVRGLRGRGLMTVTRTPLDDDGNPMPARAITYTGVLSEVNPGAGDSESETDKDDVALVMVCDSVIS